MKKWLEVLRHLASILPGKHDGLSPSGELAAKTFSLSETVIAKENYIKKFTSEKYGYKSPLEEE